MNEQQIALFGSKKTDDWRTPMAFYKKLDDEFHFDCDPCPYQSTFDGLTTQWGRRCFVNPPYSKVREFLKKASLEILSGHTDLAVFLTFSNTDTKWFHEYLYHKAELRFVKGRLKFVGENGTKNSAMRPSMIAILRRDNEPKTNS